MKQEKLSHNLIEVTLPVIDYERKERTDSREADVIEMLKIAPASRAEIQEQLLLSASTTKRVLSTLLEQGKIERFGSGNAVRYRKL